MIESIVTQVDVVHTSAASALGALASVAGVGLGTCVCHGHHNASSVAATIASSIVNALDLETLAAHRRGTAWALALTQVCVPAIEAVSSLALWV